jgi:glycosyltransferase involved in cell wall biosynthesis
VLRIIARMNVGGPAQHVSLLSGRLDPARFETLLVSGSLGAGEASMEELAALHGAHLHVVPALGPEVRPAADVAALRSLAGIVRGFRPHIVHTHTAKAGLLGRLASLAVRPRPIVVHTYHGHVLHGYFSDRMSRALTHAERALGRLSDRLVTVSAATTEELVRLGVAPRDRFETIPLGLPLERFVAATPGEGVAFRAELGLEAGDVLATFTGRLVPIKRLDVLLGAVAHARSRGARLTLAIVGDGPERSDLERHAARLGLAADVRFLGFRRDVPAILAGSDVAVLSSDNEGTPVSLIEAAAAGRPLVATRVGGVADVVPSGTGLLVDPGDPGALGDALAHLAADPALRAAMGGHARAHAVGRFASDRLVSEMEDLYERLLDATGV